MGELRIILPVEFVGARAEWLNQRHQSAFAEVVAGWRNFEQCHDRLA